jgi:hypothetical protein
MYRAYVHLLSISSYSLLHCILVSQSAYNSSSSQNRSDYLVSEQARSLSAKKARLASELNDHEQSATNFQSDSQSLKLKPPPASLNLDSFSSSNASYDNRKLRADLERAKRWIKQAEESYEELANLRYTAAEKSLVDFREQAKARFECTFNAMCISQTFAIS